MFDDVECAPVAENVCVLTRQTASRDNTKIHSHELTDTKLSSDEHDINECSETKQSSSVTYTDPSDHRNLNSNSSSSEHAISECHEM